MKRFLSLYAIVTILLIHSYCLADGNPPRALRAVSSDGVVHLSWYPPQAEAVGYLVYRALPDGDFEQIIINPVEDVNFEDAEVVVGQSYIYRVSAMDSSGNESSLSNAFMVEASDNTGPQSVY